MNLPSGILSYFSVFFAGVMMSFTPCLYPVMPITASFIAGMNTNGTMFKGFILSLLYVFGLSVSYCSMAVVAALTGKVFGQLQNSPIVYIINANVLIFFAFVMFDIIKFPTLNIGKGNIKLHRKGIFSVILFGMTAGMIVGACSVPILGALLMYIASRHNIWYGISLMFVFSYGVGFSLILVGTFTSILNYMPRAGVWMGFIKRLCGAVLLGFGEYFLIQTGRLL